MGLMGDGRFKVRVAAPPEDGKANAALIEFVATALGIRKSAIRLVAGKSSRDKILEVEASEEALSDLKREVGES
jgi:uncharacterized protein YggU (UPF0235/DUF167 family)